MNEQQSDRAFELYESLSRDIHELVNDTLAAEALAVSEAVRDRLGDEFRFWS